MTEIVVLDGYTENPGDLSWDPLAALGELTVYDRTSPSAIVGRIGEAEIVLTNKTPLTAETLDRCPNLSYIGVLATGYNVVDVTAARSRGITVTNVPTYGTAAVAQFTFALLLEICHHVGHHAETVRDGRWGANPDFSYWDYPLIELAGLTMGLIGYGHIGQATGRIAQAFGLNVLAYDPVAPVDPDQPARRVGLAELLATSDIVSLHCPLTADNVGFINKATLDQMKDGVIFLNTARGQLVEEADLAAALDTGHVAAAGLDVVSKEPIRSDNPLVHAPNCLITPHLAWASRASRARLLDVVVDNVAHFLAGQPVNVVH
jgi:glycerate dehydrogenase